MSSHKSYLTHSDFYASLYAAYGARLSTIVAERQARQHGLTLDELMDGDVTLIIRGGTVGTLAFVMALGY